MASVTGLRGVLLQTKNVEEEVAFYTSSWGLDLAPHKVAGPGRYLRGRGAEPWVLGFTPGASNRLACLRLALASVADVVSAHRDLDRRGLQIRSAPAPLEGPGGHFGFSFLDPDGREVELSFAPDGTVPSARSAPHPIRMSHVVLNSPNARKTAQFYVQALGFVVSDWYEKDAIIFMRCNNDHHCLGIGQGTNAAMNHMAFLVDDGAAVVQASELAQQRGAAPIWGPGRHGPGGNVFSYFRDPADFVCEYTAELIQIAPNEVWSAKEWHRTPQNANTWGTGGPTPLAIRLMSGD